MSQEAQAQWYRDAHLYPGQPWPFVPSGAGQGWGSNMLWGSNRPKMNSLKRTQLFIFCQNLILNVIIIIAPHNHSVWHQGGSKVINNIACSIAALHDKVVVLGLSVQLGHELLDCLSIGLPHGIKIAMWFLCLYPRSYPQSYLWIDVKSCVASGIGLGYVFPVCPVMLSELYRVSSVK